MFMNDVAVCSGGSDSLCDDPGKRCKRVPHGDAILKTRCPAGPKLTFPAKRTQVMRQAERFPDRCFHPRFEEPDLEPEMSKRWIGLILIVSLTTSLLNLMMLTGRFSTPAAARAASGASKLLDDEDFQDGLTKLIRKTVRTYCTVNKREGVDC
jgi:hypothetical protein